MRIIELIANNIKRLKAVDVTPNFTFNEVSGANGSGKSSLLDSIWYCLAGKEVIPGKPVREGCEKANVRLNLGEIVVERKFSASGSTSVSVTNADGSNWKSPQTMLDALLGELSFDPLEFAREKPKEQFDRLRKISKLPIDIDAINAANAVDYAKRTDVNREAKQKRAQAEAITIPDGTPTEPVSESDLFDRIEEAGKFNADIERRRGNREKARRDVVEMRAEAKRLRDRVDIVTASASERIEELKRQIVATEQGRDKEVEVLVSTSAAKDLEAIDLEGKLNSAGPLPDPISITQLRTALDAARATNALVEKRKQKHAITLEAEQAERAAQSLTETMAARDKQVADVIKAADMPVEGLGFGADHVTFRGIPFSQASDAERLRVSTAIAMAANPKLRIIRIKDGSLLDDNGMRLIAELAREKDFQVFLECVDTTGKVGIYMEEGEIAAIDGVPVKHG